MTQWITTSIIKGSKTASTGTLTGMLRAGKNTSLCPAGRESKGHATFYSADSGPLKLKAKHCVARVKISSGRGFQELSIKGA